MANTVSTKEHKKLNISSFLEKVDDYLYSYYHPVVLAIIAVFCYVTKLQLLGIALYFAIAGYILVSRRDSTPILPILLYFIFILRDISVTGNIWFYIMIVPVAICLVYHFIKFPIEKFNFGRLFLPIIFVIIALFLGGIGSKYLSDYAKGLVYIIPIGPVIFFIYVYFANYIAYPEDFDIKKYFFVILMVMGYILAIECGFYFYHYKIAKDGMFTLAELGWGNINTLAACTLCSIAGCCYLVTKAKNILPYVGTIVMFYLVIFMTGSDGCLFISVCFLPFLIFSVYKKLNKKNKKVLYNVVYAFIVCVFLFLLLLAVTDNMDFVTNIIRKGLKGDSGRSKLYLDAFRVFLENPVFGASIGGYHNHSLLNLSLLVNAGRVHNWHSTLFHVLGSMGIVGFIIYCNYFYARFTVILKKNTSFNQFIYFAFCMIESYGFIDTTEFSTIPCLIMITLMVLVTEFPNQEDIIKLKPLIE